MDYKQHAAEAVSGKLTYVASGSAVLLGMTANEIAALGGLAVAVIAMIVNAAINVYFKAQHLRIARERAGMEGDSDG